MEVEHTTDNLEPTDSILVAGGGLAGSLMTLYLAQRGYGVEVYESRGDLREGGAAGGRSINLALSARGLNALRAVGLEERVRQLCIPMHGRMIHDIEGRTHLQPYGAQGQFINSVSRQLLNEILMDAAQEHERVRFHFRKRCMGFTRATGSVRFKDLDTDEVTDVLPKVAIGADGAYSALRYRMQTTGGFQYQQEFASHGYKELTIPPAEDGTWRIEKNALHIWPRQDFMMIALPNLDGSFTCTLFMAYEGGPESFAALQTPADVQHFFERWFPDSVEHLTRLTEEFFDNPTGSLVTIRCAPYHYDDKVLLI
ncbi:MAG: FAD-dependent monooxygenase, partial [Myxococcota bacterium]